MSEQDDKQTLAESTAELGRDVQKVATDVQHIYRKAHKSVDFKKMYQENP